MAAYVITSYDIQEGGWEGGQVRVCAKDTSWKKKKFVERVREHLSVAKSEVMCPAVTLKHPTASDSAVSSPRCVDHHLWT